MDKRTLLFAISVFIAIFLVNMYFDSQRDETKRLWNEQQKGVRTEKLQKLESALAEKTAKPEQLPLATAYGDPEGKTFLTAGVLINNSFLTFAWDANPPKEIYARASKANAAAKKFTLLYSKEVPGSLLIYQEGSKAHMPIGNLPDIGNYDLQMVALFPEDEKKPIEIHLADYLDGVVNIASEQIENLKKLIDPKYQPKPGLRTKAIVLMNVDNTYLPVGIYQPQEKRIVYLEDIPDLDAITSKLVKKFQPTEMGKTQSYYVLENEYQQLVFSNIGGALIEINLPFTSKTNQASVVKEIEFDRDMVEQHPNNANFPGHPYYTPGSNPQGPFIENSKGKLGGYYPLIRRDLAENRVHKEFRINPRYYALNILSEYPEVAELVYQIKHFDANTIVFEAAQLHRKITKTYSLPKDKHAPYIFDLDVQIEGDSKGLWISSGVPEIEIISGSPAPALKFRITRNQKSNVENIDLPTDSYTNTSVYPDWTTDSNGFFGIIIDPLTEISSGYKAQYVPGATVPSRLTEIDLAYNRFKAETLPGYMLLMPLKNTAAKTHFRIFAGPFSSDILKTVDQIYSNPATGYNPDYIASQTFHGWFTFISEPFAKLLFFLMNFFHTVTGSWALSIILLTVALRVMLYPLNAWSTKSMLNMQQIAPEINAIKEKYSKDPKKAQLEIMNLYRERGVNPVSGCLPLLIQMPFLIGMFDLLKSTFELRGASFIPGWIDNLTSPDVLFSWATPIPYIGNQFHLLPILLGGVMFFQQRMFSNIPKDPAEMTDQQRQQKAMGTMMAIVFAFLFYHFPSGLNIYWLSSMLLGILQQWWTQKSMNKKIAEQAAAAISQPKKLKK